MSIFVNADTKVIVQGLTGGQGKYHGLRNRDYGTNVVAGVTPGKGGQDVEGIPVFDSVAEAVAATGADASFVAVPPKAAPAAILEAAAAGVGFVVCITEGIPAQDEAKVFNTLVRDYPGTRLLGPNCPGIISPGKCNIGITAGEIALPPSADGPNVGIVSRSGTPNCLKMAMTATGSVALRIAPSSNATMMSKPVSAEKIMAMMPRPPKSNI